MIVNYWARLVMMQVIHSPVDTRQYHIFFNKKYQTDQQKLSNYQAKNERTWKSGITVTFMCLSSSSRFLIQV